MADMRVKPANGRRVPLPDGGVLLDGSAGVARGADCPEAGAVVATSTYIRRRLAHGDLVALPDPPAAAPGAAAPSATAAPAAPSAPPAASRGGSAQGAPSTTTSGGASA